MNEAWHDLLPGGDTPAHRPSRPTDPEVERLRSQVQVLEVHLEEAGADKAAALAAQEARHQDELDALRAEMAKVQAQVDGAYERGRRDSDRLRGTPSIMTPLLRAMRV